MHILPLKKTSAIQINPNLGIILTADMEGWFLERYVNIFMNSTIIDYIDNVNYSGALVSHRIYNYDEVQSIGIINIIENEVSKNHYMHIWVDELYIPHSFRYNKCHFIHPLMIYGYDEETQIIKSVFFDIFKGQILIDINYQDMINATLNLESYYHIGGSDNAIKETVSVLSIPNHIKGIFHIDVFAKQLSNYICCITDSNTDWYTNIRPGMCYSENNIFGIQIYLQLIKLLESSDTNKDVNFKTLHDFIVHKKYLLDRLKYIQENYNTSYKYNELINVYGENCKILEQMRLLNMKKQIIQGRFLANLCIDAEYIDTLVNSLKQCYETEMAILPQIYEEINKLTYTKNHFINNQIISLLLKDGKVLDEYVEFDVSKYNTYFFQIDIIRCGGYFLDNGFEYIIVNNCKKFYLEKDGPNNNLIRTVKIPAVKLQTLQIYTNIKECNYIVNLYSFNNMLNDKVTLDVYDNWQEYHHVKRINSLDNKLTLLITDEDPYITRDKIGIDAENYPYLCIQMSTTASSIYAQIYFTTVDSPYISMDKSLFFKVIPDGESHLYCINMSKNSLWTGLIQTIRFDPVQYHGVYSWEKNNKNVCKIESITFSTEKPTNIDECMIAYKLNDDGSTFRI